MIIAGRYSFNGGEEFIQLHYPQLLVEVESIIRAIDATAHKTKESSEKTMPGRMLFSPGSLNSEFKQRFAGYGWTNHKVICDYPTIYYTEGYTPKTTIVGAFRDVDFVKEKLGIEV